MKQFGKLKRVALREAWTNEAQNFTPWLASNLDALGEALGLELELTSREAAFGDFSLDLLTKDLGSSRIVVIENQLTQTDHDHLGKLLTYAAGFDASIVIWISESVREEHRQTLEWLNQRTDTETLFFGVVIEVLKIDDSRPAYNFKIVVAPNQWRKAKKSATAGLSPREERYKAYFQKLIDELRERHHFTRARIAQGQGWYSFSSGIQGIGYNPVFAMRGKTRVEVYIDTGNQSENKALFDALFVQKMEISAKYGQELTWERLDEKRASRIAIYRDGSIDADESELEEIKQWHIEHLLQFKKIFNPIIKRELKRLIP